MYFVDQHFAPFYRLFCKIANLQSIDLKFSGSISVDNDENLTIVKLACLDVAFPKIVFSDFGLSLIEQTGNVKIFF